MADLRMIQEGDNVTFYVYPRVKEGVKLSGTVTYVNREHGFFLAEFKTGRSTIRECFPTLGITECR